MLPAFLTGYIMALGLILPLGPQNAFILSQGATQPRFIRALPAVIAAGVCDTLLVLVAVFGVSVVVLAIPWVRIVLLVAGIIFLSVMGWLTWRATPSEDAQADAETWSIRRQVMFAASVSLLNPHAILDTIGVIGTASLSYSGDARAAFTAGVIVNSWLFFFALAVIGRMVGRWRGARLLLNRISAVIMWISAVYLLISLLSP